MDGFNGLPDTPLCGKVVRQISGRPGITIRAQSIQQAGDLSTNETHVVVGQRKCHPKTVQQFCHPYGMDLLRTSGLSAQTLEGGDPMSEWEMRVSQRELRRLLRSSSKP